MGTSWHGWPAAPVVVGIVVVGLAITVIVTVIVGATHGFGLCSSEWAREKESDGTIHERLESDRVRGSRKGNTDAHLHKLVA